MMVYPTSKIRNILWRPRRYREKPPWQKPMIFNTGATKRMGRVDDGNNCFRYLPEEVKRKIYLSTTLVPCEYRDHKINVSIPRDLPISISRWLERRG